MLQRFNKRMGMCLPCLGGAADDVIVTPDPETRRQQLAEAAEKRQKDTAYRGIKNPEAVERKRKKQEEIEKQEMTSSVSGGGGGLKWQVG
ncbi:small VCP/p97-interacting protein [Austrofundulus limnaeus]|uniref:Small VCP/p97-interacting protein n=1 Tax=Austrofundulus limnaeus TaxID=52670 RepID=A0A2I4BMT2_AUSLI|nr:PREDICTED: small VCP/p97-interacting protein [Austrofundulus limnaeus]